MDACYVDTETTSLRDPWLPGGRRTWEVAIIRDSGVEVSAVWLQIVNVNLAHANDESLRIGRFADRFTRAPGSRLPVGELDGPTAIHRPDGTVIDAPTRWRLQGVTEAEAARWINRLTAGTVLYGSRPEFDAANFADILRRHGVVDGDHLPWYHHSADIASQALGWLRATYQWQAKSGDHERGDGWAGASYSTGALSEACGVPVPADRHSAWADAAWVRRWDHTLRGGDLPEVSARPKGADSATIPG